MHSTRFDRISKAFAGRRVSQPEASAAPRGSVQSDRQDATPAALPEPDAEHGPEMLFVQTYQSGTIAPVEGSEGRYTLALKEGTGQTVYFSDRPDRIVGSDPTPQFLEALGFLPDNPPNAALVVETAPGESDVAVVELFDPLYDPITHDVTYEVAVLSDWQTSLEVGFTEAPTDLAALAPSFTAAQLFIDDCPDMPMDCVNRSNPSGPAVATIDNTEHDGFCYSFFYGACLPCQPWYRWRVDAFTYWTNQCNGRFSDCHGQCVPRSVCSDVIGCR
jgi:hypothetical protein